MNLLKKDHLAQLDILRVLAAFAVCAFHLNWHSNNIVNQVFNFGYLGVDVFFCLSGFLTPLVFGRGNYRYSKVKAFLVSRFFRLYPAFLAIALIEICLYYFGCSLLGYGSHPDRVTWARTMANFFLIADFVGEDWYIVLFWTLAVEVQFYLLMIVSFPLLASKNKWVAPLFIVCLAIGPLLVGKGNTILTYTALFGCGTSVFLYFTDRINYYLALGLIAFCTVIEMYTISYYAAFTAAFTAMAIIHLPQLESKAIKFLSKISYSFFLIHITIGGAVLYQLRDIPNSWFGELLVFIAATLMSGLVATGFFYLIENPFHKFARKLKSKITTVKKNHP